MAGDTASTVGRTLRSLTSSAAVGTKIEALTGPCHLSASNASRFSLVNDKCVHKVTTGQRPWRAATGRLALCQFSKTSPLMEQCDNDKIIIMMNFTTLIGANMMKI